MYVAQLHYQTYHFYDLHRKMLTKETEHSREVYGIKLYRPVIANLSVQTPLVGHRMKNGKGKKPKSFCHIKFNSIYFALLKKIGKF